MKTIKTLTIVFYCLFMAGTTHGQCPMSSFQTSNVGTPPCGSFGQVMMGSGTFSSFSVDSGISYTFSTCGSTFDTEISGYQSGGGNVFYNNDNGPDCSGQQASVTWTSSFTGTLNVMVNRYPCQGHDFTGISAVLKYAQISPVITPVNSLCPGQTTTLVADQPGGTWSGTGVSGNIFTAPSTPGNYAVTYSLGQCAPAVVITVNQLQLTTITPNGPATFCEGGTVTLMASPSGNYLWSNGATAQFINVGSSGSYAVTVTNANRCSSASPPFSVTVNPVSIPVITAIGSTTFCAGGSVTLTASAGATYLWSPGGATTQSLNVGSTGSYTVTVGDSNGCSATSAPTMVTTNSSLAPPIIKVSGCTNSCSGTNITLTSSVANGYLWSPGGATTQAVNVGAGIYTVTISNSNGCTASSTIAIAPPPLIIASINSTVNVSCFGGNNGTATVNVSNGVPSYSYIWSNGQTGATATHLAAGNYTVTVTGANGCTAVASTSITAPTVLSANIGLVSNVSCNGGNNGKATINPSGGTSPYSYTWSNGQTNITATHLAAGNYTVTVTDTHGCTTIASVTITQPPALAASICMTVNVTCHGGNNGSTMAHGTGGTSPYTFAWSNGQTTATATHLSAGTFSVTVTDANGCTAMASVIITQPTAVTANISSVVNVSCYGGNNGKAIVSATGGISPYTFAWSNGQTAITATHLAAGNYTVTVTDAHGCTIIASVTITQPPVLTASTCMTVNVTCHGGNNGSATAHGAGGTSPYTFAWSNGQTTATATNLSAGTYTATVTDANGCTATATVSITQPGPYLASIAPLAKSPLYTCAFGYDADLVFGYGTGPSCVTLNATVSGGTPPFTYSWSPAGLLSNSNIANPAFCPNQSEGCKVYTFVVIITDSLGCQASASMEVKVAKVNIYPDGTSCSSPQVLVCHIPPVGVCTHQTICISPDSVPSHLGGLGIGHPINPACSTSVHPLDCLGSCDNNCAYLAARHGRDDNSPDIDRTAAKETDFIAYPNPFNNDVKMELRSTSESQASLRIIDLQGRVLMENKQVKPNEVFTMGGELKTGIYIIDVIQGDFRKTLRLVKTE